MWGCFYFFFFSRSVTVCFVQFHDCYLCFDANACILFTFNLFEFRIKCQFACFIRFFFCFSSFFLHYYWISHIMRINRSQLIKMAFIWMWLLWFERKTEVRGKGVYVYVFDDFFVVVIFHFTNDYDIISKLFDAILSYDLYSYLCANMCVSSVYVFSLSNLPISLTTFYLHNNNNNSRKNMYSNDQI